MAIEVMGAAIWPLPIGAALFPLRLATSANSAIASTDAVADTDNCLLMGLLAPGMIVWLLPTNDEVCIATQHFKSKLNPTPFAAAQMSLD